MRKVMLKKLQTVCVITTITGLTTLAVRAADTAETTTGTAGYGTTTQSSSPLAEHGAKSFIKQAFRDNQMEIDLAGVGVNKAQNADLKSFCQQIQQDHTQANQQLQPLAQKYGVTEEQSKLREHEVNKFEKETAGPDFDKKLATEMLKGHQKDISKFERASNKLQEADVKQYAETMLPKLREHLQHAATVARAVGVDQSTISSAMSKSAAVGGTSDTTETQTGSQTGTDSSKTEQGAASKQLQPDSSSTTPTTR
jgi:putative membrane protein